MTQPLASAATLESWRAQVEKELAGVGFEKALVHTTAEGLALQPLYVEGPAPASVPRSGAGVRVVMRHDASAGPIDSALDDDIGGGADGVWVVGDAAGLTAIANHTQGSALTVIVGTGDAAAALDALAGRGASPDARLLLGHDPIGAVAAGRSAAASIDPGLAALPALARKAAAAGATAALVSTLPYHGAGADAADELAIALSTGAAYLGALVDAGIEAPAAAAQIAVQIAVGRDTFLELAKLRALRVCWHKLTTAAGAPGTVLVVHAVSSSRTLAERDPWVNMLRVTTQVFAAVLGGADLVTPASFDEALGPPSPLGRRVARNTALVLREESHLGRVVDPAAGSYYLESVTDGLAREAWSRFQGLEREGGVAAALVSGALAGRLDAAWKKRQAAIGKRKELVLGVSEFANLDESHLPRTPLAAPAPAPALARHRDAEPFEVLRNRVDALGVRAPDVLLLTLGPPSEHRGRVGYATAFFATAGLRVRESTVPEAAAIAVVCGADDRYATEAVDAVRALKTAGVSRVVLAGRPGAIEAALKDAGIDGFLFVGCDVVTTLNDLIGGAP